MQVSSSSSSSTILGLLFLQTTSEELGTPRDGLLSSRKAELKQRLLQLIPQILAILTGINMLALRLTNSQRDFLLGLLQTIWEKRAHSITSTPPPSPTNPLPPESSSPHQNLSTGNNSSSQSLNSEAEPVARLVLQCLTHFFTWIPLSSHVTPQLMELIFRFVGMGTEELQPMMSTSNGIKVYLRITFFEYYLLILFDFPNWKQNLVFQLLPWEQ